MFFELASTKKLFLLLLHMHFGCYGNLRVSIEFNGETRKLALIAVLLQVFWQNVFGIVCSVVLHQA